MTGQFFLNHSYTVSSGGEPCELLVGFPQWAIVERSLGLGRLGLQGLLFGLENCVLVLGLWCQCCTV